jgi:hypothetical protein
MERGNRKILVYRPLFVWLAAVALAGLSLTGGYFLYNLGQQTAVGGLEQLTHDRGALGQTISELQKVNLGLREKIAMLERSSEIDRRASLEVRNQFRGLQDELLELRKELAFYKGIVSPGDVKPGIKIQRFHLEPGQKSGRFAYSLTLTQVKRNDRYVRGVIEIDVEGVEDGTPTVLPITALADGNGKALSFKFRYYQDFKGEMRIPAEFQPQRVRIRAKPRGKGQPPAVEQIVKWPL